MELTVLQNTNSQPVDLNSMKDILAKYELGLPKRGDVLTGEVISSSKNNILVDLGTLGTGIIYPSEFYDNPNLHKSLKKGEKISVILLDFENEYGYRELSLKKAQMTTAWDEIRSKKESGEIIATSILNMNKGGLIVEVNGIQGFLPLSQLAPEHYPKIDGGDTAKIVQALQKFKGQVFNVKILDFSEEEGKLIVSERAIMNDKLKEEIAKFKIGDAVDGTVTDITDFGAFVKINERIDPVRERPAEGTASAASGRLFSNGIEGLVHISEIDWKLIENPKDHLKVGEAIKAKIINIENGRISLSLKALRPDPWEKIEEQFKVGQTVAGEIAKITNYGLLVKVSEQIMGLVPGSEVAGKKDWTPKIGDKINVAIVNIEPREHKMLLTLQSSESQGPEGEKTNEREKEQK